MAEDSVLAGMVKDLAALGIADFEKASALVETIILRWCGVADTVAMELGRGAYANGAHLAALEAWNDTPFVQTGSVMPRADAGAILQEQWDVFSRNIAVRLILQTEVGRQLFPEIQLVGGDFLSFATQPDSSEMLARLKANEPEGQLARLSYWHAGLRVLDTVYGSFSDVTESAYRANVEAILKGEGIDLDYYALITARIGSEGDDGVITQSMSGGIYVPNGRVAGVVLGGSGNDEFNLGDGRQIVYYGKGQGNDRVYVSPFTALWHQSTPRVEIRLADLGAGDVSFQHAASNPLDLIVTIVATGETLTLVGALAANTKGVSAIVFGDGMTIPFSEALPPAILMGGDGSEVLVQGDGVAELDGGAGNDILMGGDGTTV